MLQSQIPVAVAAGICCYLKENEESFHADVSHDNDLNVLGESSSDLIDCDELIDTLIEKYLTGCVFNNIDIKNKFSKYLKYKLGDRGLILLHSCKENDQFSNDLFQEFRNMVPSLQRTHANYREFSKLFSIFVKILYKRRKERVLKWITLNINGIYGSYNNKNKKSSLMFDSDSEEDEEEIGRPTDMMIDSDAEYSMDSKHNSGDTDDENEKSDSIDLCYENAMLHLSKLKQDLHPCPQSCSKCKFGCMKYHGADDNIHDCFGDHKCKLECEYCIAKGVSNIQCKKEAGHSDKHDCKHNNHKCNKTCHLSNRGNCQQQCDKTVGHDGDHLCSTKNQHLCNEACQATREILSGGGRKVVECGGKCQEICNSKKNEDNHIHKCKRTTCDHFCTVKCRVFSEGNTHKIGTCNSKCGCGNHFHDKILHGADGDEAKGNCHFESFQDKSSQKYKFHCCDMKHACPEKCANEGVCEWKTSREFSTKMFKNARGQFEYAQWSKPEKIRHWCMKMIPVHKKNHRSSHKCEINATKHGCSARCDACGYNCRLSDNHAGLHKAAHGNMNQAIFVSTDRKGIDLENENIGVIVDKVNNNINEISGINDDSTNTTIESKEMEVKVDDRNNNGSDRNYARMRQYLPGDSGCAEICSFFCQRAGRGHIHVTKCDAHGKNRRQSSLRLQMDGIWNGLFVNDSHCLQKDKNGKIVKRHARDGYYYATNAYRYGSRFDEMTHEEYWKNMGFEDPCHCGKEQKALFSKCNFMCSHPSHKNDDPSYCTLDLWHILATTNQLKGKNKSLINGHLFECKHPDMGVHM